MRLRRDCDCKDRATPCNFVRFRGVRVSAECSSSFCRSVSPQGDISQSLMRGRCDLPSKTVLPISPGWFSIAQKGRRLSWPEHLVTDQDGTPRMVVHFNTNRAWRKVTSLIRLTPRPKTATVVMSQPYQYQSYSLFRRIPAEMNECPTVSRDQLSRAAGPGMSGGWRRWKARSVSRRVFDRRRDLRESSADRSRRHRSEDIVVFRPGSLSNSHQRSTLAAGRTPPQTEANTRSAPQSA